MSNCTTHFACDYITEKVIKLEQENAGLKAELVVRNEVVIRQGDNLKELSKEIENIIKSYNSVDHANLPVYHPIALPAIAFDRLKRKYLLYKGEL